MKKFFKVKAHFPGNPFNIWVPVKASTKGEVIVIMDKRCNENRKTVYIEDVVEIDLKEYEQMLFKSRKPVEIHQWRKPEVFK